VTNVFYRLSKVLAWVADPSAWVTLLVAAAVAAAVLRRPRLAAALAGLAGIEILAFSSPAFVDLLQGWLASSAQSTYRADVRYDAAIVLGGADERVVDGAEVVRSGGGRHLLYSGALSRGEAEAIVRQLRSRGVPESRVLIEARSRNTYENAVESSRVAAERGWRSLLVVTSASHVERALGCFRQLGLDPDVLPVDDGGPVRRGWGPSRAALEASRSALHEIIGRVVYRAVGYST
jgi:uncharacterized SAM-binding protein YcdF (DUF218 family)